MTRSRKALLATTLFPLLTGTMLSAIAGQAQANMLSAEINNDTVKLDYKTINPANHAAYSFGVLHHQDNGQIFSLGLAVESQIQGQQGLYGALGGKLYYLNLDGAEDGAVLGLGGHVRYALPAAPQLSLFTEIFYSPEVLSGSDFAHHTDLTAAISYRMLERGSVFIGYRKSHIEWENGADGDFDEGAFFGIRIML